MDDRASLFIANGIREESEGRRDKEGGRGSRLDALKGRVSEARSFKSVLKGAGCAHRSKEGIHTVSQKFTGRGSLNRKALE